MNSTEVCKAIVQTGKKYLLQAISAFLPQSFEKHACLPIPTPFDAPGKQAL